MKTWVFVDFWNFQINLLERTAGKRSADWNKLPKYLMGEAARLIDDGLSYMGTRVYLSYNPRSEKDRNLKHWASNVLSRYRAINVDIRERKPKGAPVCQACHDEIYDCPHCGSKLQRTTEKGVDAALLTDLFRLAWDGAMDAAVLLTSDKDFIPAVEMLSNRGIKIINAHFPPEGAQLAKTCWANFDVAHGIDKFSAAIPKKKK